jgi:hypothetical protein
LNEEEEEDNDDDGDVSKYQLDSDEVKCIKVSGINYFMVHSSLL